MSVVPQIPRLLKFTVNRRPILNEICKYSCIIQYFSRDYPPFFLKKLLFASFFRVISLAAFIFAYTNTLGLKHTFLLSEFFRSDIVHTPPYTDSFPITS